VRDWYGNPCAKRHVHLNGHPDANANTYQYGNQHADPDVIPHGDADQYCDEHGHQYAN